METWEGPLPPTEGEQMEPNHETADRARLADAIADRYRLERQVGSGGMAIVYLAHDLRHDRKVALKVLRPELAAVLGAE